ncbi:MAG: cytochrome P460 family protein [Nitrospirae bacterium]|nr:cytochrome P460 family protein [Nitrospirota bacterium]
MAYAIHETIPSETQIPLPGADATKLYEYVTRHKPYSAWQLWPGKGRMYKGTEPHGALLTTYVDNTALGSIKKKRGMADGSIIVKENYSADKKLAALTVMYKLKGYNPAAADWFWAKYDDAGKVLVSGKAEGCINCHQKKKDNEYIFTGEVKK